MSKTELSTDALRRNSESLSRQNTAIGERIEQLVEHVEGLEDASQRSDWHELQRLAQLIVLDAVLYGMPEVAEDAEALRRAAINECQDRSIEQRVARISRVVNRKRG